MSNNSIYKFRVDIFKNIYSKFLDFIYPRFCTLCNSAIQNKNIHYCNECEAKLLLHAEKRDPCKICGINLKRSRCSCSKTNNPSFKNIYSLFDFNSDLKKIVHEFKYSGLDSIASYTASKYRHLIPDDLIKLHDIAVPVPLHFFRKRKRGYNQANVLAQAFFPNKRDIEVVDLLQRKRYTRTQTTLDRRKRSKNLKNSICVKKSFYENVLNKNILLIDDVITTGATAEICSSVLMDAGAKSVTLLSLARA